MHKRLGRPAKPKRRKQPPTKSLYIGDHPADEIREIDAAARASGLDRESWAWAILLRAARVRKTCPEKLSEKF